MRIESNIRHEAQGAVVALWSRGVLRKATMQSLPLVLAFLLAGRAAGYSNLVQNNACMLVCVPELSTVH